MRALGGKAGYAVPDDRLRSLSRREVHRYLASLFDLAADARLFLPAEDVAYLLANPPGDWSPGELQLAAYLVKSGLLSGEPRGDLAAREAEELLLRLAVYLRVVEPLEGTFLALRDGKLAARLENGDRSFALPGELATFRDDGLDIVSGPLSLVAGDRLRLYVRGERLLAVVQQVDRDGVAYDRSSTRASWNRFRSDRELAGLVRSRYPGFELKAFELLERGSSGRVGKLRLLGNGGETVDVEGLAVRWTFDLPDTWFTARRLAPKEGAAGWQFTGRGWGHGVGLCQVGSFGMARRGHDYREILTHYYTGVRIERWRGAPARPAPAAARLPALNPAGPGWPVAGGSGSMPAGLSGGPLALDFSFTPEQLAVQETAREFARREIDPIVDEHDESQKFPMAVMKKAAELGFLGIIFPEELGGAGLGYVDYVLVVTELSAVDPSVGISVAAHNSLGTNHIYKFGSAAQRERWVAPLARGEKIAAWALTEAGAGSDAAAGRTRARKVDGGWVLDGAKVFCTHGSVGDLAVVLAVTEPEAPKGTPHVGVRRRARRGRLPHRQEGEQARHPRLRHRRAGLRGVLRPRRPPARARAAKASSRRWRCSTAGGSRSPRSGWGRRSGPIARRSPMRSSASSSARPIAEFQAIRFMLAEMATRIAAARDPHLRRRRRDGRTGKVTLKASEAKLMAGEAAVFCAERGVQIHGGYGLVKDYRAEKFYRDAKICTIGEGTSEIQRLVIARQLLAKG